MWPPVLHTDAWILAGGASKGANSCPCPINVLGGTAKMVTGEDCPKDSSPETLFVQETALSRTHPAGMALEAPCMDVKRNTHPKITLFPCSWIALAGLRNKFGN